jgi:hypothetical protein
VGDLSTVRQGWSEIEQLDRRLLCRVTPQESFRQWSQLQQAFEAQLRETSALFGSERLSSLAELQARLRRLVQWQEGHGELALVRSETPAASAEG